MCGRGQGQAHKSLLTISCVFPSLFTPLPLTPSPLRPRCPDTLLSVPQVYVGPVAGKKEGFYTQVNHIEISHKIR